MKTKKTKKKHPAAANVSCFLAKYMTKVLLKKTTLTLFMSTFPLDRRSSPLLMDVLMVQMDWQEQCWREEGEFREDMMDVCLNERGGGQKFFCVCKCVLLIWKSCFFPSVFVRTFKNTFFVLRQTFWICEISFFFPCSFFVFVYIWFFFLVLVFWFMRLVKWGLVLVDVEGLMNVLWFEILGGSLGIF